MLSSLVTGILLFLSIFGSAGAGREPGPTGQDSEPLTRPSLPDGPSSSFPLDPIVVLILSNPISL